jgi:hypothetical protein
VDAFQWNRSLAGFQTQSGVVPVKFPMLTAGCRVEMIDETTESSPEGVMDEILTMEQIEAQYAPEWVLIGDPETDESQAIRRGKVLFHSLDRHEVCQRAMEHPPGRYALWFLGSFPKDVALVL